MVEITFRHSKILAVEDYRICNQKLVKLKNIYFENVMYQWLKIKPKFIICYQVVCI